MTLDPSRRPTFYQGQYLGPEDLAATVEYGADHAARHALGAHTWGIGEGLGIIASVSPGSVEYWIQPGVAWDGFGRTLLVEAPLLITPDRLRGEVYDPVNDAAGGTGRPVAVWLRYREDGASPPRRGFNNCVDGGFSRALEGVEIVARNYANASDTRRDVDVAGRRVAGTAAISGWYPGSTAPSPAVEDGSVAFQRFPASTDPSTWLVPIGVVRWKVASAVVVGALGTFEKPDSGDAEISRRLRRHVGVLTGTVLGTEGLLRLRSRSRPAPTVWTDEPIWLEETTRLDGDLRLLGGANDWERGGVDFLDEAGTTRGRRVRISRHERSTGTDLRIQIGPPSEDSRLVIGTELPKPPPTPPEFKDSVVVTSDGRVGIGIAAPADGPTNSLHVTNALGIRQGLLFLSGAAGGSSLTYNAHRNETNDKWVSQDSNHAFSTIELDDADGRSRFQVWTAPKPTAPGAEPVWKLGLHLDGVTNHLGIGGAADSNSTVRIREAGESTLLLSPTDGTGTTLGFGPAGAFLRTTSDDLSLQTASAGMHLGATEASVTTAGPNLALRTQNLDRIVIKGDRIGLGTTNPRASFHAFGDQDGDAGTLEAHVAIFENRSVGGSADVLALRVGTPKNAISSSNNFITFFAGDEPIGRIEGPQTAGAGGVSLVSGGADFAESMPTAPGEQFAAGDVVAIVDGRATRLTGAASWISVITDRAIVVGNAAPEQDSERVTITMIGQVPVKVSGQAMSGDLLVPSGSNDGRALAYSPDEIPVERANQVFGEVVQATVSGYGEHDVTALLGAHARSAALVAIVQRVHESLTALSGGV